MTTPDEMVYIAVRVKAEERKKLEDQWIARGRVDAPPSTPELIAEALCESLHALPGESCLAVHAFVPCHHDSLRDALCAVLLAGTEVTPEEIDVLTAAAQAWFYELMDEDPDEEPISLDAALALDAMRAGGGS